MVIRRRAPRNPHGGPSCLFVLFVLVVVLSGGYVISNPDQVRDAILPDPTPEPTRNAVSYATSADLLARDGELTAAIAAYETAIALDSDNAAYFLPLIELLLQTKQPATALEWALQATELIPDDDRAWTALAASYLAFGKRQEETGARTDADLSYQQAVNAAEAAVERNPANADAYAYMAGALAQLGRRDFDFALAQERAELALALDPDSINVRRQMATVLELQGFYDGAIEQYEIALQSDPNNVDLHVDLGYLYFFTDSRQQGILEMEEATELDPNNADAFVGLAYFYFLIGEYSRAEENAFAAVQLDPEMTRAHSFLGAAYFKQNNYFKAIEELEQAAAQYGEPNAQNATYFNMLGLSYYFMDANLCDQATPIFDAVLAVALPDSPAEFNAQEGLELCRLAALENN